MATKLMAPNTTIWWVPVAGIENPAAPTYEELSVGVNISCALVSGYTLNPTDSDTDDTRSICDESNVATPTRDKYEASLQIFRGVLSETTGVYYAAYNIFEHAGAQGYLVRRIGKKSTEVLAEGDKVELYLVESDYPQVVESDNNGPILMTVPFLSQGFMLRNYTVPDAEEE
jgi:hypothetical protein